MKVLKFGGTSVGSAQNIRKIESILKSKYKKEPSLVMVVSAFSKVTDGLIKLSQIAMKGDTGYTTQIETLKTRHYNVINDLFSGEKKPEILKIVDKRFEELKEVVHGVCLLKELTPRSADLIMSFGERLSAFIIAAYFSQNGLDAHFTDARELLVTNSDFGAAVVNRESSFNKINEFFNNNTGVYVATGFIASNDSGITTTLGRGGSDFTASIFGAALDADEVHIWTDVNGVLSADPGKVCGAFALDTLSYEEAMELSHFGAKVIHPPTMQPVMEKSIPLRILNTFEPEFSGTLIQKDPKAGHRMAKGIASIDDIALLTIKGSGMVGVTGISSRLFGTLARAGVNVILISQASSEHTICIAVRPEKADLAKNSIEQEFELEINAHRMDPVKIEKEQSVIAIVGEQMCHKPGIAGRVFNAFGEHNINVAAIAQGSSELNISVVISKKDEIRALNCVHDSFFSDKVVLNLILFGIGLIGKEFLQQLNANYESLIQEQNMELRLVGIANSRKLTYDSAGLDPINCKGNVKAKEIESSVDNVIDVVDKTNLNNCIFVDCTASKYIGEQYQKLLKSGISVVAANKTANTADFKSYADLKNLGGRSNVHYLYETNAGAGLPIISTLQDLSRSGDKILKIEAILSGTISYIFNNFNKDISFSKVVKNAQEKGYTEPDPRDDLSGLDFARKLLLLARESGRILEPEDIKIDPILPPHCLEADSVENFYEALEKEDSNFHKMVEKANSDGKVLRYIAKLEGHDATIQLQTVGQEHPFYSLAGSDNIVAITTSRYLETPLVIKGAGASAAVTAAGVMADVFKIANAAIKRRTF